MQISGKLPVSQWKMTKKSVEMYIKVNGKLPESKLKIIYK